jgi:hypothetical protein
MEAMLEVRGIKPLIIILIFPKVLAQYIQSTAQELLGKLIPIQ